MRNIARNYFHSGNTENMSTFNRLCGLHTDSVYTYQHIVWRQLRPYCSFTPIHAHAWKNSNEELQKKRITWKTHKQCELRRRRKKCEEHKNKNALERYTLCMCFLLDVIISIIFFFLTSDSVLSLRMNTEIQQANNTFEPNAPKFVSVSVWIGLIRTSKWIFEIKLNDQFCLRR